MFICVALSLFASVFVRIYAPFCSAETASELYVRERVCRAGWGRMMWRTWFAVALDSSRSGIGTNKIVVSRIISIYTSYRSDNIYSSLPLSSLLPFLPIHQLPRLPNIGIPGLPPALAVAHVRLSIAAMNATVLPTVVVDANVRRAVATVADRNASVSHRAKNGTGSMGRQGRTPRRASAAAVAAEQRGKTGGLSKRVS